MDIAERKKDHIELCLNRDVQFNRFTAGFDAYHFSHRALPEIDIKEIDTSIELFGKKLSAPIFVSSMTGGPEQGKKINTNLAKACQKLGLAMGLGSQRIIFELAESLDSFLVRDVAPDILLLGNIGAVQLNYGFDRQKCIEVVESVGADALYFHLNPLQEAIQPEGDTNFQGITAKIKEIAQDFPYPVILKETGCGISAQTTMEFNDSAIAGIDVSGGGGTSWALIESFRGNHPFQARLGETFRNWGIPTAESLRAVKKVFNRTVFASGGIRTGIDAAKAIALGADAVGIAHPLLKPATESAEAVEETLRQYIEELRITMFCLGVKNIAELKSSQVFEVI